MIKAACHIHSEWSYDGKWTLPELAEAFRGRGYRVLLMTEHDRGFTEARLREYRKACADASTDKILVVPGIEYSDAENVVHILVWGVPSFLGEGLPTDELLRRVDAASGLAVFAHPSRKDAWKKFSPQWASRLLGVEFWNRKTDGWAPSRTAAGFFQNSPLIPFVGMDFHTHRQFFPLVTEIKMEPPITEASVLRGIKLNGARATAFGRPVEDFVPNGWCGSSMRTAEWGRRLAAQTFRRLKHV